MTPHDRSDDLDQTLAPFLDTLRDLFGPRLVSVVLYGSAVLNDLAPGYGDLDFLAVVDRDLSDQECHRLVVLRKPLREGTHGILAAMLEGAFLPQSMLCPADSGTALWWGTSGERVWHRNELGWFDLYHIREHGIRVYGDDIRIKIPAASRADLLSDARKVCQAMRQHGRGGNLHSIDWLFTTARLLLWLQEDRLCSKSRAAEWGVQHAMGDWRNLLPRAKEIRQNPIQAQCADTRVWLEALTEPIQDACAELERELGKHM